MCYVVYLSTTSTEDLSRTGSELFHLYPVDADESEPALALLRHPHRWYLECKYGGCSCHFRHAGTAGSDDDIDRYQWFGPPADWCPEDEDDIESTAAFYDVLARLVSTGEEVDLVDVWSGTSAEAVRSMDISLSHVDRESFQFFENCRFEFRR